MKKSELISLYNKGKRDFLEEIFRKQNFAGQDLSRWISERQVFRSQLQKLEAADNVALIFDNSRTENQVTVWIRLIALLFFYIFVITL